MPQLAPVGGLMGGAGMVAGVPTLASIPGLNAEFEIDATLLACVSDADQQLINSAIASPATGVAASKYGFYRGPDASATAADPTLVGTPGDAAAYYSLDGNDRFVVADGDTDFIRYAVERNIGSETYSKKWWAIAFRASSLSFNQKLIQQCNDADYFFEMETRGNNGALRVDIEGNPGQSLRVDTGSLTNGTDYLIVVSYDTEAASNNFRVWINSATASETTESHCTWTAQSPAGELCLCGDSAGGSELSSGTRFYGAYAGNAFLTNALVSQLYGLIEARHARPYIPA